MADSASPDQLILAELHRVPSERWGEVLSFIRSLQAAEAPPEVRPIVCGADLVGSDLIGVWAGRSDMVDSQEFARQLRREAEQRDTRRDAPGH